MIGADVDKYITRFHELARLLPQTVTPECKRIDRYIRGLAPAIRGTMETSLFHGEYPEGNLKQLKTMKVNEQKLEDIPIVREFPGVYQICNKGQNKDKTRQNQAQEGKEREKTSLTVPSDIIGPARNPLNEPGQPMLITKPNKNKKIEMYKSWVTSPYVIPCAM
ncbi:hypothetical protein Tco_1061258 [Tanacetum coccineum]